MSGNGIHLVGEEARKARQAAKLNAQTITRGEVIELIDTAMQRFASLVEDAFGRQGEEISRVVAANIVEFWEGQDMPPVKPPKTVPESVREGCAKCRLAWKLNKLTVEEVADYHANEHPAFDVPSEVPE